MLWGSFRAKIDAKYRLKIPSKLLQELPETENNTYFVTSDDGKRALIYPLSVWEQIAEKLQAPPRLVPAKLKMLRSTSFYGMLAQMDPQGRILLPPTLRVEAQLSGEVRVMPKNDHWEVWNEEIVSKNIKQDPVTDEDREKLAELGI